VPHGVILSCERYTTGFPVCYGSPSDVFAASSGFVLLYGTLRYKEKRGKSSGSGKGNCRQAGNCTAVQVCWQTNFQPVSGIYKNFTRMSPSEFEFSINLFGEKNSEKETAFRKAIFVQEISSLTLRFLASGDSYVSLQ